MRYLRSFFWRFLGFFFLFFLLTSQAAAKEQILIAPKCLLSDQFTYEVLAKFKKLRLIQTKELEKLELLAMKKPRACGGFLNVTSAWQRGVKQHRKKPQTFLLHYAREQSLSDLSRSHKIQYQAEVNKLLTQINAKQIEIYLTKLAAFPDRYAQSQSGVETAKWLSRIIKDFIKHSNYPEASVVLLPTQGAKQSSVILRLGPSDVQTGLVIGAHMDTLPQSKIVAHDDATGAATLLEVARVLLNSGFSFKKPIYLIWYAAEKEGKLGSQTVIESFNQNRISIDAVLQLDMTGYRGKKNTGIGLTDDLTDAALTAYVADLINRYVKKEAGIVQCGYACSDHITWYLNGNRIAYPFETMDDVGNPYVNTPRDTLDKLSFEHMVDFVKLGLAFAVELGEPTALPRATL